MRASRARRKEAKKDFRSDLIGRTLPRSSFLLGSLGKGKKMTLMVPRVHALAELNAFLQLPEAVTDEELKAVLRLNGWSDHHSR